MSTELAAGSEDSLPLQLAVAPVGHHTSNKATVEVPPPIPESRLALLHRAAVELNSSLDLNAVLQTVLRELTVVLRANTWAVWLNDLASNRICCVMSEGPFSSKLLGLRVRHDEGALGWAMTHGQSVRIDDPATDARYVSAICLGRSYSLR